MNLFNLIAPIYAKVPFAKKSFEKIFELGRFKKTDKVLDLGGGAGRIAKFFVGQVEEITVADASANMIKHCQRQGGVNCVMSAAENLTFAQNYFDKIIIIDAFHHFSNQQKACQEVNRVLKEGGRVIIEEFYFGKILTPFFEKIETLIGAKSRLHSPNSLAQLFSNAGFKTQIADVNKIIYYLIAEKI